MNTSLVLLIGLLASTAVAQTRTFPLPKAAGDRTKYERTAPFKLPDGIKQTLLTDRQSLLNLPATLGNWDMVGFDPTGRFVFVPCEVGSGGGVFRYDTGNKTFTTLMLGNNSGVREADPSKFDPSKDDFIALDPATWTPWGTVITGEETAGGRMFEITNPMASSGFKVVWRSNIPAVAHEGLRFDSTGALYFVDEQDSGSIYKFVPTKKGDLSVGQSFALCVDAFVANPSVDASLNLSPDAAATWDSVVNRRAKRFGAATWRPLTDANGKALTKRNPFAYVSVAGGSRAADEIGATPYGRPEDLAIGKLANGNEVVYCTLTSENRVLSIELISKTKAFVREYINFDTLNQATGRDVNPMQNDPFTSPVSASSFDNPDNLAIDAFGNVYVLEDNGPGDIWKCFDADGDGVAESMARWASLGVSGAEPTGLIAHPTKPYRFIVVLQHPASGNDALWQLDTRPYPGSTAATSLRLASGVNRASSYGPGEFVRGAKGNHTVTYDVTSPDLSLVGKSYILVGQVINAKTGPVGVPPGIWAGVNFAHGPVFTLSSGTLTAAGARRSLKVPNVAGIVGLSLVTQCAVIGNGLFLSSATEVIFEK